MQATKQVLEGAEDSKRLDIFEDVGAYLEASFTPIFEGTCHILYPK